MVHAYKGPYKRAQQVTTLLGPTMWSCWHFANERNNCQHCWRKVVNSRFCPKLFLYLFIGPLTFFPSNNSLYLTRPRGKSFPRGQSAVPPRNLTIFWCIYSRFSIFCLNISCFLKLFAQLSLIRHVYNNSERRKRLRLFFF